MLYNRLGKAITSMNQSINKFKSFSFFERDNGSITRATSNVEDEQIDKKIEKNMLKSRQLQDKIYKEKRDKLSHVA